MRNHKLKKKELILIADCDPRTKIVGGVGTYSYHLAKNLSKKINILFLGKKQATKPIKKVNYTIKIANNKENENNIKFFYALRKLSEKIKTTDNTIIHAQRPDWLVSFSKLKGKKIFTLHGSHFKNMQLKKGKLLQTIYSKLEKKGFEIADKIISVDSQTTNEYKKKYPKYANKIITIPVGVDTKLFKSINQKKARKELNLPIDKTIFLCISRLSKEKRIDEMIKNTGKDELLIVIGCGDEEKKLKHLASKSKSVIFLNAKPQTELTKYYSAADAFLIFSTHEGLTTTALESWACGTPIVSTKVGDLQKIVNDKNGILVQNEKFREALNKIKGKKQKISKSCRETAIKYDWKKISERIFDEAYQ